MSQIPFLKIYSGSTAVVEANSAVIDFTAAGFSSAPIVNASVQSNINVYVTNVTQTSATIRFSSNYTGVVSYIVRQA